MAKVKPAFPDKKDAKPAGKKVVKAACKGGKCKKGKC